MKWPTFVIIGVIITLILVVYGVKMLDEEDDDDKLTLLNITGTLGVDVTTEMAQLTLEITNVNGYFYWGEYSITAGGKSVAKYPVDEDGERVTKSKKGDVALWRFSNSEEAYRVGEVYTVKILIISNSCIEWQKDIVAIAQDIPAPEG